MSKYSHKQEFLDLGFTSIKDHGAEKPQCVLSYKVLSNESLKKNKLETFGNEAPATCEKELHLFSVPRNGTDTKQNLFRNESSTFSLQASHAGIVCCLATHK